MEDLNTSTVNVANDAPVVFDGNVEWIDGGRVVLTGDVSVAWTAECFRCLGKASGVAKSMVREVFEPKPTEGETYQLNGDVIDIEPMMREAVALEFPIAPLCKADCAGLCPQCGVDKNTTACDCETEPKDIRWAALGDIPLPPE